MSLVHHGNRVLAAGRHHDNAVAATNSKMFEARPLRMTRSTITRLNIRAGKNLGFKLFFRFLGFRFFGGFKVLTYKYRTQNYDQQAKIRQCERRKSQFIFEYHLY